MAKRPNTLTPAEWETAKATIATSPNYDGALEYLTALMSEAKLETTGQVASMIGQIESDKGSLDGYLAAGRAIGMNDGEIMTARQSQVRITGLPVYLQHLRALQAQITNHVSAKPAYQAENSADKSRAKKLNKAPVTVTSE